MSGPTREQERTVPGHSSPLGRLSEFLSKKWVLGVLTIVPPIALFVFVNLLPIGWAVSASFYEVSALSPDWTWTGVGNYAEVLPDTAFQDSLWRSLVFAGGSVSIQLVVGTALALLINREFSYSTFVRAVIMLPYLVPTAILGFAALWIGNSQFGIANQLLMDIGLVETGISWFGDPSLAMLSIILTTSWKFTIFVTIMVLARLQGIPDGLYEAAKVSGATKYQIFRDITLPNLKGVIFIVLLLRGVWMFNMFDIVWVLTNGGPINATTTAPVFAYIVGFTQTSLGKASAISTLLFVLLIGVAIIYFKVLEPSSEVRVE